MTSLTQPVEDAAVRPPLPWNTLPALGPLPAALRGLLEAVRTRRRFDASLYVAAKAQLLNAYLAQHRLTACITGVSGGIDSAVVLALLAYAKRLPGSPLRRVQAVLMPSFAQIGASGQHEATRIGEEVTRLCGAELVRLPLTEAHDTIRKATRDAQGELGDWSAGQLVSYLRTTFLYHQAAVVTESGHGAIVVGTTNRDEGSYIGYFGKAADGMADLQLISDLHKSEVYAVADVLGLPASVTQRPPTGDTFDNKDDFDLIGASYDGIELMHAVRLGQPPVQPAALEALDADDGRYLSRLTAIFDDLHRRNRHKYVGDSPAVHMDLYPRALPGGWRTQGAPFPLEAIPEQMPAAVEVPPGVLHEERFLPAPVYPQRGPPKSLLLELQGVLSATESQALADAMRASQATPADRLGQWRPQTRSARVDPRGSLRATTVDKPFADTLWRRIEHALAPVRIFDAHRFCDAGDAGVWRPVGVSSLLRFMTYSAGAALYPHYDGPFDFGGSSHQTLMSVIIFLSTHPPQDGGVLRFLPSLDDAKAFAARRFDDEYAPAADRQAYFEKSAQAGDVLLFDHRLRHEVTEYVGSAPRLVIRTDVIYERCAHHVLTEPC